MEGSTPLEIAALVLQLLANECDNRKISKLAKEVISSGGFSQRPVFICAAKECEENIRLFMEDLITQIPKNYKMDPLYRMVLLRWKYSDQCSTGRCLLYYLLQGEPVAKCALPLMTF